jgi:5-methylcytosine-specific restriction protein A
VATPSGWCARHAAERATSSAVRRPLVKGPRIYDTKQWKDLRRLVLAERPMCEEQCGAAATEVDHKVRVSVRPDLAFVRSNLQARCKACHSKKTARETGWRRRR